MAAPIHAVFEWYAERDGKDSGTGVGEAGMGDFGNIDCHIDETAKVPRSKCGNVLQVAGAARRSKGRELTTSSIILDAIRDRAIEGQTAAHSVDPGNLKTDLMRHMSKEQLRSIVGDRLSIFSRCRC